MIRRTAAKSRSANAGLLFMNDLLLDIRYALRVLWKSPAFTLVAALTLMLGIGANVLVFGVVNAVLLRPLDVSEPHNLYQLRLKPWTSGKALTTSYPAFEDYRQRNTTFSGLAGYNGFTGGRLRWGNTVKSVSGYSVTGNYFDLLGVQPQLGRLIQSADDHGRRRRGHRAARQTSFHSGGRGTGAVPRHGAIWLARLLDARRE